MLVALQLISWQAGQSEFRKGVSYIDQWQPHTSENELKKKATLHYVQPLIAGSVPPQYMTSINVRPWRAFTLRLLSIRIRGFVGAQ